MSCITAKDLAQGLVITQPGHYRFTESVEWATQDPNARAITIACDNVTLDLGRRTRRPSLDSGQALAIHGVE